MSLAFVHAADLHLDSPLRGLAAYPGAPVERLRGASRQAFSRLVEIAIERRAQLMLLAGDVWDGDWPDVGTGLYFAREMGRLQRAGVRVVLLRGNHDAESRISKSVPLPDNVVTLDAKRPQSIAFDDLGAVVHGQSFERPDITDNIALAYPDPVAGRVNIGLLHTALEGDTNHATYAPCRLADLQAKGYDYWALGHVHQFALLADGVAIAGGTIAYPGVLQGRHARETGEKGALWVEIDDRGARVERLIVDVVRWHVCDVDLNAVERIDDVTARIKQALEQRLGADDSAPDERLMAIRLRLVGRTSLHNRLHAERARLREDAVALVNALAPDGMFLERIECNTEPVPAESTADRHDALAELQQVLACAESDAELLTELGTHLTDFWNLLPADVRRAIEDNDAPLAIAIREQVPATLVASVRASLLERLARGSAE